MKMAGLLHNLVKTCKWHYVQKCRTLQVVLAIAVSAEADSWLLPQSFSSIKLHLATYWAHELLIWRLISWSFWIELTFMRLSLLFSCLWYILPTNRFLFFFFFQVSVMTLIQINLKHLAPTKNLGVTVLKNVQPVSSCSLFGFLKLIISNLLGENCNNFHTIWIKSLTKNTLYTCTFIYV